jgi:16S rRNA (uracil1498-N3)-methyltransferase
MAVNRFFIQASDIEGGQVRLSPEQSHKAGDTIVVLDDSGVEYEVTLTGVCLRQTVGRVTGQRPARGEPATELVLFQSLLAREKFEWVLQKGTEVGVAQFVPVLTERSLVRARRIEEQKLDRWRRIVTEAAEQSQRGRIPKIAPIVPFPEAVAQLGGFDRRLIAAPFHKTVSLHEALQGAKGSEVSIALMIGPEGGFTEEELALAQEKDAVPIGLGPRVLRTETAAVVAAALILYEQGEMGP